MEQLRAWPAFLGNQKGGRWQETLTSGDGDHGVPRPPPTQDLQLFREAGGWDVVKAVAEFWCSRVEWSPGEERYHLRGKDMRATAGACGGRWGTGGQRADGHM